jgi:hypothetical protein
MNSRAGGAVLSWNREPIWKSRLRLSNRFIVELIAIALAPYASIAARRDLPSAAS